MKRTILIAITLLALLPDVAKGQWTFDIVSVEAYINDHKKQRSLLLARSTLEYSNQLLHEYSSEATVDYKNLNVALSTAGYRTREPIDIPAEPPMALASAIRERLATGQPVEAIAADLLMTPHDFLHTYGDLL